MGKKKLAISKKIQNIRNEYLLLISDLSFVNFDK